MKKELVSLGVMSGTSCDGLDLSIAHFELISASKYKFNFKPLVDKYYEFPSKLRESLLSLTHGKEQNIHNLLQIEKNYTDFVIKKIKEFVQESGIKIDIIGFHGQTIYHSQKIPATMQIGNGVRLSRELEIPVCWQVRQADIAYGGSGAPLAPIYHWYILRNQNKIKANRTYPTIFLNIGGISNITFIPKSDPKAMLAGDIGTGNALIDDICKHYFNRDYDHNGEIAASGKASIDLVNDIFLKDPYFSSPLPKSLDRNHFSRILEGYQFQALTPRDKVATLTYFTARSITYSIEQISAKNLVICGGGVYNKYLIGQISCMLPKLHIFPVSSLSFKEESGITSINEKFVESQLMALLAAFKKYSIPASFPGTTGAKEPVVGGELSE